MDGKEKFTHDARAMPGSMARSLTVGVLNYRWSSEDDVGEGSKLPVT